MSKPHVPIKQPRGSVAAPALAVGGMSLVLAVGFQSVGLNDRIDHALLGWLGSIGLGTAPVPLPPALGWLVAVAFGFLLPFSILGTPGAARRLMLWLSCLVVVLGLLPVLGLSARWWPQSPGLVSVIWSGLCAMVYASRHRMPCEGGPSGRHTMAKDKQAQ